MRVVFIESAENEQSSNPEMATSSAIREEYMSSLADLEQNSKPMIDMLTMLAEDHRQHAQIIVDAIKQRISQVLLFYFVFSSTATTATTTS